MEGAGRCVKDQRLQLGHPQPGVVTEEIARLEIQEVHPIAVEVRIADVELLFELLFTDRIGAVSTRRDDAEDDGGPRRVRLGRPEVQLFGIEVRLIAISGLHGANRRGVRRRQTGKADRRTVVTHLDADVMQADRTVVGIGDLDREDDRRLTGLVDEVLRVPGEARRDLVQVVTAGNIIFRIPLVLFESIQSCGSDPRLRIDQREEAFHDERLLLVADEGQISQLGREILVLPLGKPRSPVGVDRLVELNRGTLDIGHARCTGIVAGEDIPGSIVTEGVDVGRPTGVEQFGLRPCRLIGLEGVEGVSEPGLGVHRVGAEISKQTTHRLTQGALKLRSETQTSVQGDRLTKPAVLRIPVRTDQFLRRALGDARGIDVQEEIPSGNVRRNATASQKSVPARCVVEP